MQIDVLIGKTLIRIDKTNDEIIFNCNDNTAYKLHHYQDCCESVTIDDIEGDLGDLIGSPITQAEEVSNEPFEKILDEKIRQEYQYFPESHTWTFYKLATVKGYVTIRWYGESNGYYSEYVSFDKI